MDYDTVVGVLEVCNVLQCKNQIFLDNTSRWLVNKLDRDDYETVVTVNEKLKSNIKINFRLNESIRLRILYKTNPSAYFPISRERSDLHSNHGKIMLIIYPKGMWGRMNNYGVDIYRNWCELHIFNQHDELTKIIYSEKNQNLMEFMGTHFRLESDGEKNGISLNKITFKAFLHSSYKKVSMTIDSQSKFKFLVVSNCVSEFVNCDCEELENGVIFSNELLGNNDSVFILTMLYRLNPLERENRLYVC